MALTPRRGLVEQAMLECGITEERAIELLKIHGNQLRKVKRHLEMLQKYEQQDFTPNPSGDPSLPVIRSTRKGDSTAIGRPVLSLPCSKQSIQDSTPSSSSTDGDFADMTEAAEQRLLEAETAALQDWDFVLPIFDPPDVGFPDIDQHSVAFSPLTLVQAIENDFRVHEIQRYLSFFDAADIRLHINDLVSSASPIFYAVAAFNVKLVRLLAPFGADVNAVHEPSRVPLLGFAIIYGEIHEIDSTAMVCTLLSLGASPLCVPPKLYTPYTRDTATLANEAIHNSADPNPAAPTAWCSLEHMSRLVSGTHLSHRYFLHKAHKSKPPSARQRQVARLRGAEDLLGVPYFLVGQQAATDVLIQQLLRHLVMPTKRPLVLCFAGPSGHGKTELARQLGSLLSLNLEVVDCTVARQVTDLFGPSFPYQGWQDGSAVNNFLAANAGQRSIVFLDEFEKTTKEIHESLLLPFDDGEYRDRRNKNKVNCSGTIWILATNAFDDEILDFYKHDGEICSDDRAKRSRSTRKLSDSLRKSFLQRFGGPLTGRISDFIPFLPFSIGEQAVITHKYLRDLKQDLRLPIVLSRPKQERLIGNIRLHIRKDSTLCSVLANDYYHQKLGARSLIDAAKRVKHLIVDEHLDDIEEIEESTEIVDYMVDVEGEDVRVRKGT